jgi:demethylmenaquinone methyltransferase/2-methoxy-6-polyprenyl-1,4-benzoquinol methylase
VAARAATDLNNWLCLMQQTTSHPDTEPVRLPHRALPDYYAEGDLEAREKFLRKTFDDTAVDYDRLEKILGLGTGSWYRRQALTRAGLKPGMQVVDVAGDPQHHAAT